MTTIDWANRISKRHTFTAIYVHNNGTQMLLRDVYCTNGQLFRDHLFIPYTARMKRLALQRGDCVRLTGKVNRYFKKAAGQKSVPRHLARLTAQLEITNITSISKE